MKIRCEVCDKTEASVFCCADEAALCDGCDHLVHYANKLASKHMRFSLLLPSLKEFPICDICQVRRAFLFCLEDRAILCRECDLPIHEANEHTQNHNRFLLTGVKLSATSSLYPASSSSSSCDANINIISGHSHPSKKPSSVSNEVFSSPSVETVSPSTAYNFDDNQFSDNGSISTSSISEYLETLPGWCVDDLLDPAFATNGLCKTWDHFLPFVDQDLESYASSLSSKDLGFWVSQVSPPYLNQTGLLNGLKESTEANNLKISRKRPDNCFTVPQIRPPSLKKTRHFP